MQQNQHLTTKKKILIPQVAVQTFDEFAIEVADKTFID